jgi:hypothetical protein
VRIFASIGTSVNSYYFLCAFARLTHASDGASATGLLLINPFFDFRLHWKVNQDNWIHVAERIQRIIDNGNEKYRCIMGHSDYNGFLEGMNQTKGGAWHLKKILLDAIAYVMAGNDSKVQVKNFHKEEERAKKARYIWTLSQRNKYYADLIKKATTLCNTIAMKVTPLLKPIYGDFNKKCGELCGETAKRKRLKSD